MAAVDIPIGTLVATGGTVSAGGTINVAEGAAIVANGYTDGLILQVVNSGSAGTVIITAGDTNPPTFRKGLGNLSVAVAAASTAFLTLEGARFSQSTGNISITFANAGATDMTGRLFAYRVNRSA